MIVVDAGEAYDLGALTNKLDLAIDWIQILPSSWLVYTTTSAQKWVDRLKTVLPSETTYFAAEVSTSDWAGKVPAAVSVFMKRKSARIAAEP